MAEWKEYKLDEVIYLVKDTYKPKAGDNLPYIGLEHIQEQGLKLLGVGNSDSVTSQKFRFQCNDVLFGKLRPYFRKVVKPNFQGVCSTDIWVIRALSGTYDQNFIFCFVANQEFVDTANSGDSGTRMPRADWNFLKDTIWHIPPLPEQRAIAGVLSSLDDKIDLLHRQNKTLEGMAEALWRKIFVEDADENWETIPFYEFFDFLEGPGIRNWQYTSSGIRFINIRLINDNDIDVLKANFVSYQEAHTKYKHFLLQEDDMIVSTSGTLGKTAIVRSYHLPLMLNTSVIRFRPRDGVSYSFMYQYLKSSKFQAYLEEVATGSVQPNFGPVHLRQMFINRPPKEILNKYLEKADALYRKIKLNYYQIHTLSRLRDTLLPKLMSGEVRVKGTAVELVQ